MEVSLFKLDNNKICKISGSLNDIQTCEVVLEQLKKCGNIKDISVTDNSSVFESFYLGGGVAILLLRDQFRNIAVKNDFKIFYFVDGFSPLSSKNVHIAICFTSIKSVHQRTFKRISEVVFNYGSDVFFDTERTVEDICCWIRGDSLIKNYINFADKEIHCFKAASFDEGLQSLKTFYSSVFSDTQKITDKIHLSENIYCEVYFSSDNDSTVFVPSIIEFEGEKKIIFSVIAGKDMLFSSLLNTLSIVSIYDYDSIYNVSRETLLKNLESLPIKITREDRDRITKLNNLSGNEDRWNEIVVEIKNEHGLHARPAVVFTKITRMFKCPIWIRKECDSDKTLVNAKDFMQVLTMNIKCGDRIVICSTGINSTKALQLLNDAADNLFSTEFYQKMLSKLCLTLDD